MSSTLSWNVNIDEVEEYIQNLELASLSAEQSKAFAASLSNANSTAFVNRGSIFYVDLPAQSKSDALNWTLFGQLAADARVNREKDPEDWYKEYVAVLERVGMRANGWSRNQASGSEAGTTVDSTALRYLKPFLSPGARAKIDGIIRSLRNAQNTKPLSIFNSSASSSDSANFQVSDGTVDRALNLTIHAGFMDFKTNQAITNLLYWTCTNRNFTFFYASDSMTLAKNLADRLRSAIVKRVTDHIAANIGDIQLA